MKKLFRKIVCTWRKIFKCPCPKCPYFMVEAVNPNLNTSGVKKTFRCKKDGVAICDNIMEGSGVVIGCPKFWTYTKALVTVIAIGFSLIITGIWIGYYHLLHMQEKYYFLMWMDRTDIPELFLIALGMTLLFIPLTILMYIDFSNQN